MLATIAIVAVLVFAFFGFASVYADVLWYRQLGFDGVLFTEWGARAILFVIGFVGMGVPVWASLQWAYRSRPVYAKLNSTLDRYQEVFEPLRRLAMWGAPALLGVFAGVATSARWEQVLTYLNRTPFGRTDPQFGFDIGFYVFELPFYRSVLAFASAVVLLAGLLALATAYLYGAIRIAGRAALISKSARVQLAVFAGVYVLLQAVSIWFDQYATVTETGETLTGAGYTDVNAVIPGKGILAAIALLVAVLFFVAAAVGRWRLPLIGTALLVVSSIVVGGLYPWIVQRFQVVPSARTMEAPYIQRDIDLTRQAYDVDDVQMIPFAAKTDAEPGALRADAATTASIRLMDPAQISDAFKQLQQFRQYYTFTHNLDVDRYQIAGKSQDTVVATRELSTSGLGDAGTWYNAHVVYTHGYGLVAVAGNQRSVDGQPVFIQSGIPEMGKLGKYEPRVYFGENSPTYSIVGAPSGTAPVELDYPSGTDAADQTQTTFAGNGGPKLDNFFNRLVYALKFQSEQIVLSNAVNDESQILYDRDPATRVKKVAPYLHVDSDPYPSVVDGRLVWIVDGYTTSDRYPYSHKLSLGNATPDASGIARPADQVNYIRNSVKATVDAYDGSVKLYAWDAKDPILQTWQKVFPSTLRPMSEMSGDLMSHVRYPTDLFELQREVLGRYHVTDAGSFYSREDAWTTPKEPTAASTSTALQRPYYLTMQMPGQTSPAYSLYSTFIPESTGSEQSRNVLRGYLAVDSDAGASDGSRADGYGKLRLLTLPESDNVPGPGQVQAKFNGDVTVSQTLNLLKTGNSSVISGNLLTLPVGGGLLYVQPVYVKSTGNTSFPLLQKVLVAFGDKISFKDTLDQALNDLFGGSSGASAGDQHVQPTTGTPTPGATPGASPTPGATATPTPAPGTGGATSPAMQALLDQASQALKDKQAALAAGDLAAFGVADKKLNDLIAQMIALSAQ